MAKYLSYLTPNIQPSRAAAPNGFHIAGSAANALNAAADIAASASSKSGPPALKSAGKDFAPKWESALFNTANLP
jgi:hypothetical protein